jgi:hypothetical protein
MYQSVESNVSHGKDYCVMGYGTIKDDIAASIEIYHQLNYMACWSRAPVPHRTELN